MFLLFLKMYTSLLCVSSTLIEFDAIKSEFKNENRSYSDTLVWEIKSCLYRGNIFFALVLRLKTSKTNKVKSFLASLKYKPTSESSKSVTYFMEFECSPDFWQPIYTSNDGRILVGVQYLAMFQNKIQVSSPHLSYRDGVAL